VQRLRALKVALVVPIYNPKYPIGGVNRWACELVPRLKDLGLDVDVITVARRMRWIGTSIGIASASFKLLKSKYDVVHAGNFRAALPAIMAKRNYVLTVHDLGPQRLYRFRARLQVKAIEKADLITTPTRAIAEQLVNRLNVEEEKIHVVHNGVDTQKFRPLKVEKPSTPIVAYVGRMAKYKASIFPHIVEELRRRKVSFEVRVSGGLSDDELVRFYNMASVVVVPTMIEEGEGFSFVTAEALSCQVPVVVSDIPAIREVAGPYALYARPGDVKDFADKIEAILKNPDLIDLKAARKRIENMFSWRQCAEKMLEMYKLLKEGIR